MSLATLVRAQLALAHAKEERPAKPDIDNSPWLDEGLSALPSLSPLLLRYNYWATSRAREAHYPPFNPPSSSYRCSNLDNSAFRKPLSLEIL
jgi:hypothetical protein